MPRFVVREVFKDGHELYWQEHLDYIPFLANRVGFSRIDGAEEPIGLIRINIPMANPVFKARLEEEVTC